MRLLFRRAKKRSGLVIAFIILFFADSAWAQDIGVDKLLALQTAIKTGAGIMVGIGGLVAFAYYGLGRPDGKEKILSAAIGAVGVGGFLALLTGS